MAINWIDLASGTFLRASHEGLVLPLPTKTCEERVMSDVYAPVRRACVWDLEKKCESWFPVYYMFECSTERGDAIPDATPDVLGAWEAWKADREAARLKQEAIERRVREEKRAAELAAAAHEAAVKNGVRVRIVGGAKVDRDKEGVVFWKRDGRIGIQIGNEKLPNGWAKNVAWTTIKNVVII